MKKLLSFLLAMAMTVAVMLLVVPKVDAATVYYANGKAIPSSSAPADGSNPYCKSGGVCDGNAVGSGTHYCCWYYAAGAYKYIWGTSFSRNNNYNYLRNISAENRTLTVDNLKKYFKDAVPGANVRFDKNSSPTAGDNDGHSLIFLKMNEAGDGAYFLEGNYDNKGRTRIKNWLFKDLVATHRDNLGRKYIKYIIWPKAPGYNGIESAIITEGTYYLANGDYYVYMIKDEQGSGTITATTATVSEKCLFNITKDSSYYKISPTSTNQNYVLNCYWGKGGTQTASGNEITLWANDGDLSQRWIFEEYGSGYLIHPADRTDLAITREDSKLVVRATTKDVNQIWKLKENCNHSYQYKSNSSSHWKECTLCGDKQSTSSHSYTNNCDTSCNTCGYTRTTTHTYTNSCDKSCNVCGATRTITHTYNSTYSYDSVDHWKNCTVCGDYGTFEDHVYTNSCDKSCNVCGATRTITHTYNHDCDTDCNVCGATRTTTHSYGSYSYDSDMHWRTCTICGYVSTPSYPYHYYTYDCDTDCNECGYIREAVEEHIWMPPDPTDESTHTCPCRYCEAVDIRQHVYTNVCDTSCNHCKYERTIIHTYDNDCDPNCNVCSETRSTEHVYDNEQDTTCNICNAVKTVETLPSSTPDETEPSTTPNTKLDTNNTPSSSNKNDNNDDEDNNNTTIIIVAVAGAVTVSAVSIFGTVLIMKKKR